MISKNLKYFSLTLVLIFSLSWGTNLLKCNLDEFFYWHQFAANPQILAAQANQLAFEQNLRDLKPKRDRQVADLEIRARSAISVLLNTQNNDRILLEKNIDERLPIASLSKLMVANVVLKYYDLDKEIQVSQAAIDQEEDFGKLSAGLVLSVRELLYPLLMESSNDAAFSLANDYSGMSEQSFVKLMNSEAQNLNLTDTYFVNSTGLDPDEPGQEINYSSAHDLVQIVKELLKYSLVWEILSTPQINLYGQELLNTNRLLNEMPQIVGGKTGYTDEALGCFLLVSSAPKGKGYLVNVILGTTDRFNEMARLINWLYQGYLW